METNLHAGDTVGRTLEPSFRHFRGRDLFFPLNQWFAGGILFEQT